MAPSSRFDAEESAPGWLSDYGSIEVDTRGLRDHAAALLVELDRSYTPHREQVNRDMIVESASPDERFLELGSLLHQHWESRVIATALLTEHGNATGALAAAATTASTRHDDTDALAARRLG